MSPFVPDTVEELQRVIAQHHRDRHPLCLSSRWAAPADSSKGLALSKLQSVIDYPHRDMTITVQTGIPVAELQRVLAEQNQWLPLDVPRPETVSIADLILDHWYGSLSAGYGTIRDWLLGVAAVDGSGRLFHAGGRVVKNVAGYDLCKLLVGSSGRLGIPVEATLQVRTIPECLLACRILAETPDGLLEAWKRVRNLPLKPVVLDASSRDMALTVAVEGTANVTQQLAACIQAAVTDLPGYHADIFPWNNETDCWHQIMPRTPDIDSSCLLRVGVLPSQSLRLLAIAREHDWQALALTARGTVYLHRSANTCLPADWNHFWTQLMPLNPGLQCLRGPDFLLRLAEDLRLNRPAGPLMCQLQKVFDPAEIFAAPGSNAP